jgi:hypothetical protein
LHPLAPVVCPLVVGFFVYQAVVYVRWGRVRALPSWGTAAGLVLWALLVAVWVARFFGAFGGPVSV